MQFKKIIAALDFTDMDDIVISHVRFLSNIVGMEKIYFMHIIKSLTHPDHIALEMHQFFKPDEALDEKLKSEMQKTVEKIMPPSPDIKQEYEVHEGNPVEKMLHWAEIKNIDLVVFGNKNKSEGSGLTPKRMAHRLKSNILLIPEIPKIPMRRVVVPMDYSDHSVKALEAAIAMREKIAGLHISVLHIIEMMPVNHYPASLPYQQYTEQMKAASEKSYNKLIAEKGIDDSGLEKIFIENSPYNVPKALNEYLKDNPCDLVMIGAQGHSKLRNFFYGSTTERFIDLYKSSPVLIIR